MNATGEVVNEVPIPKGTQCMISIWLYNRSVFVLAQRILKRMRVSRSHDFRGCRLKEVWGEDAEEFNPYRFIEHEKLGQGQTYVGVTSNLMTFSAGLQACIGWRFS